MSDYPPVGKELKALRLIEKKVALIRKLESIWEIISLADDPSSERDYLDWGITEGHALEGVRCNGISYTTTIVDIIMGSKRILDDIPKRKQKAIDCFDRLANIIREILEISNGFIICSKCKGLKGEFIKLEGRAPGGVIYASYAKNWQDCEMCQGRGVLVRESNI